MNLKPLSGSARLLDATGADVAAATYHIAFHLAGAGQVPTGRGYLTTDADLDTGEQYTLALKDGRKLRIVFDGRIRFTGSLPIRYPIVLADISDALT